MAQGFEKKETVTVSRHLEREYRFVLEYFVPCEQRRKRFGLIPSSTRRNAARAVFVRRLSARVTNHCNGRFPRFPGRERWCLPLSVRHLERRPNDPMTAPEQPPQDPPFVLNPATAPLINIKTIYWLVCAGHEQGAGGDGRCKHRLRHWMETESARGESIIQSRPSSLA